jgi:hypothetical protein
MASISRQSKDMQERHRRVLANMLKLPENRECADCRARNPTWASTNLGVFLCIRCSGLHRQAGVHITKVKSCTMDLWEPEQIAHFQRIGNQKAKLIYEAKLPPNYGKPSETEDAALVLQWIRAKYEKKKFIHDNPMSILEANASSSSGSPSSASTPAAGVEPRFAPGRGRKDRQQVDAPAAVNPAFNVEPPQSSAFGFIAGQQAQPSGFASNESSGHDAPAFGEMPGSAFGFIMSPVTASPTGGMPFLSSTVASAHNGGVATNSNTDSGAVGFRSSNSDGGFNNTANTALSFDATSSGRHYPTRQNPSAGAGQPLANFSPNALSNFDPFGEVDQAHRDSLEFSNRPPPSGLQASGQSHLVSPYNYDAGGSPANPFNGSSIPPSAGQTVPGSPMGAAQVDPSDFAAKMKEMQEQLRLQQEFLDRLQTQGGNSAQQSPQTW